MTRETLTLAQIRRMTPISVGQFDDLLTDTGDQRTWFSRMTIEDGAFCDNQVTIEILRHGIWIVVDSYEAR